MLEIGLSLLAQASMPLKFWDEAFLSATYLINKMPSPVTQNLSPFKKLFGIKPNYSMLKVFSYACWPHLKPYNAHKLSFKSKQCTFIGYSSLHKGYKCLHVPSEGVYISRDIVFDEYVFPFFEKYEVRNRHTSPNMTTTILPTPFQISTPNFSIESVEPTTSNNTENTSSESSSSDQLVDVHFVPLSVTYVFTDARILPS